VLDVGAGYGAVTEEVLKAFPQARVTLQDYSTPMLGEARRRLAGHAAQLQYVTADLTDPGWAKAIGGPFDLAVSAIALHNLRDPPKIFACYRSIHDLLRATGWSSTTICSSLGWKGTSPSCAGPALQRSNAPGRSRPAPYSSPPAPTPESAGPALACRRD
jgi:SAM-dependent methyltransferase